ncbi:MAG: response regulator, partial [Chloroflexi bacterium]|nr:response regulator [Chloroflexota bacterium]
MANVLVIEDDRDTRTFLSEYLCDDGHETDEAAEGLAGIEKATTNVPDVILLDVLMPILDGFQVLAVLQADERTSRVPVVMLSGKNDMDTRARAFKLGAVDYLVKGRFEVFDLERSISYALHRKAMESEMQDAALHDPLTALGNRALFDVQL